MRHYRIMLESSSETRRYHVIAGSLTDDNVVDIINTFAGTPEGLAAARRYIADVQARNVSLAKPDDDR